MKKEQIKSIQYLGAKWREKVKEMLKKGQDVDDIEDYACNNAFAEIAKIEKFMMFFPSNSLEYQLLKVLRRMKIREGTAFFIGNADILTNLAIKAGEVEEYGEW